MILCLLLTHHDNPCHATTRYDAPARIDADKRDECAPFRAHSLSNF